MGLQLYDPTAVCPKCGEKDAGSTYHEAKTAPWGCYEVVAHIHRSCHRCGYDWAEAPLDAKAAEGGSTAEP